MILNLASLLLSKPNLEILANLAFKNEVFLSSFELEYIIIQFRYLGLNVEIVEFGKNSFFKLFN
jgi:hypothetical protein